MAAARVATHRRSANNDGEAVLALASALQDLLTREAETGELGYLPPPTILSSSGEESPRLLKTGGQYSRRAAQHGRRGEYMEAAADLLRALLRPGLDQTARDKLMWTLEDFLKKAETHRAQEAEDGDLSELFEVLELEDDTKGMEIDKAALKRQYKRLSVKYHPDKNPESASHFNQIRDAYEILSDPVKALLFDTGGMELVRNYEGDRSDLGRTQSTEAALTVTLEDLYRGATKKVRHARRIVCRMCRTRPDLPRCRRCKECPGETQVQQIWLNDHQYTMEEVEVPSDEYCKDDMAMTEVTVERGMMNGESLPFPGMGSQTPKEIPGDLIVQLKLKKHPLFERSGNDLMVRVRLTLFEALLGFERELAHLDGHVVTFGTQRGDVVKPGSGMKIKGEGMPHKEDPQQFGNLIVQFEIDFPSSVDASTADALEAALHAAGQGVGERKVTPLPGRKGRSEL